MAKPSNRSGVLGSPSWQGIGVIISVVGVVLSVVIAYDIFRRSTQLSKLVVEREYYTFPIDFGRTTSQRVSMVIDGTIVKSVVVYSFSIENLGRNPVLPGDYVEPVRVATQEPWRLLTVESADSFPSSIKADWTKVATDTYELKPMLLNPGDRVRVLVFMTNLEKVINYKDTIAEPIWSARIVNVPSLEVTNPQSDQERSSLGLFYFSASFSGWSLYLFAFLSILLFILGMELQNRFRRIPVHTWWYRIIVVAIMCLSLATADTILVPFDPHSRFVWASYVLLILHIALLIYLVWPAFTRKPPPSAQSEDLLNNLLKNKT